MQQQCATHHCTPVPWSRKIAEVVACNIASSPHKSPHKPLADAIVSSARACSRMGSPEVESWRSHLISPELQHQNTQLCTPMQRQMIHEKERTRVGCSQGSLS
jgi:hypothetical protein